MFLKDQDTLLLLPSIEWNMSLYQIHCALFIKDFISKLTFKLI